MIDKGWVKLNRVSLDYKAGLRLFLEHSMSVAAVDRQIKCPCRECGNTKRLDSEEVRDHLIAVGMFPAYEAGLWLEHGEDLPNPMVEENIDNEVEAPPMVGDMMDLLFEAFCSDSPITEQDTSVQGETTDVRSEPAEQFNNLLNDADTRLYPGSKMSKLEFLVRFFQVNCLAGITDKGLTLMLKLIKSILPDGESLPNSFYQAKKIITDISLQYLKIDACPSDCMLYWKDKSHLQVCPHCGVSRYQDEIGNVDCAVRKVPAKVLRYFPLMLRLQRLYSSRHTSENMVWHATKKSNDGLLRHPADSPAWKELDKIHPSFASEVRNVRLGLASDGFNPFGHMSTAHSTWPVVVTVYNLPPWLCMKQPYMILSLLIPGPTAPGNDIYICLSSSFAR